MNPSLQVRDKTGYRDGLLAIVVPALWGVRYVQEALTVTGGTVLLKQHHNPIGVFDDNTTFTPPGSRLPVFFPLSLNITF